MQFSSKLLIPTLTFTLFFQIPLHSRASDNPAHLKFEKLDYTGEEIENFERALFLDEATLSSIVAKSKSDLEYQSLIREQLDLHFDEALRSLVWTRIFQKEALNLGMQVDEEHLTERYQAELDRKLAPFAKDNTDEAIGLFGLELQKGLFKFEKLATPKEAFSKWETMKKNQILEFLRQSLVNQAARTLAETTPDKIKIPYDKVEALYKTLQNKYWDYREANGNTTPTLDTTRTFLTQNPEIQMILQPTRIQLNRLAISIRPLAEYKDHTQAFANRLQNAMTVSQKLLSDETVEQNIGDFKSAVEYSKTLSLDEISGRRTEKYRNYLLSKNPGDYLNASIYEMAQIILSTPGLDLVQVESQLRELMKKLNSNSLTAIGAGELFYSEANSKKLFQQILSETYFAQTQSLAIPTGTLEEKILTRAINLSAWGIAQLAEKKSLEISVALAKEIIAKYSTKKEGETAVATLNSAWDNVYGHILMEYPVDVRDQGDSSEWYSLMDQDNPVVNALSKGALNNKDSCLGRVGFYLVRTPGNVSVQFVTVSTQEEEKLISIIGISPESQKVETALQTYLTQKELVIRLGNIKKDLLTQLVKKKKIGITKRNGKTLNSDEILSFVMGS